MARFVDAREGRAVPRTSFTKNDGPVAIVQNLGWKEQAVFVEFVNRDTNKAVFQQGAILPRNDIRVIGPREPIPAGNYYLKVTPRHSAPLIQNFAVYGY